MLAEEAAELAQKRDALPAISSSPAPEDWRKTIEALLPSRPQPLNEEPVEHSLVKAPLDEPFVAAPPPPPPVSEVVIPEVALPEVEVAEECARADLLDYQRGISGDLAHGWDCGHAGDSAAVSRALCLPLRIH